MSQKELMFSLDANLGLHLDEEPFKSLLISLGIKAGPSSDLVAVGKDLEDHKPDISYVPSGVYHRLFRKGDYTYRGLVMSTSKWTGDTTMKSVLVVRKDDPATSLDDLEGSTYGYINRSCSSTFYPPSILLAQKGRSLESFLDIKPVFPGPTWEGLVDAVTSKQVRATMVLEDVWKTFPKNADDTKIIGEFSNTKGPIVLVREGLDETVCKKLEEALLAAAPEWTAVYGGFKPAYYADLHSWFHDLNELPAGE